MKFLLKLLVLLAIIAGVAWFAVGRMYAPSIDIRQPARFVGSNAQYEFTVSAPQAELADLAVEFEQNGQVTALTPAEVVAEGDGVVVRGPIGRGVLQNVQEGAGKLRVSASRMAFGRIKTKAASAEKARAIARRSASRAPALVLGRPSFAGTPDSFSTRPSGVVICFR